jgi:hypothetical protein
MTLDHVLQGFGKDLLKRLPQMTEDRVSRLALSNARANRQYLCYGQSIRAIREETVGRGSSALVIAAGPSLHRRPYSDQIKGQAFDGAIVTTDSGLVYCLRNGIVPDLVVTIDPHAKRIVRWFGDPQLSEQCVQQDDYFSRQDMDRAFADELAYNQEVLALIDRYGPKIRLALSTVSSEAVVRRAISSGMQIYWWNPMLDEPHKSSLTMELFDMNGFPCINACGNVGAASWMIAGEVLGKQHVGLLGMDFSYYEGTPYRNTQYYDEAVKLLGEENLDRFFIRTHNPYLEQWFFSDPAYYWYRQVFLEIASQVGFVTYNCTEGGILFGDPVRFIPFSQFLREWASGSYS